MAVLGHVHGIVVCPTCFDVLLQVALSTVGGLLSKLAVLRDTPQLLQRTALLVEHQVAPEGARRVGSITALSTGILNVTSYMAFVCCAAGGAPGGCRR
jgi:hypothetical protein